MLFAVGETLTIQLHFVMDHQQDILQAQKTSVASGRSRYYLTTRSILFCSTFLSAEQYRPPASSGSKKRSSFSFLAITEQRNPYILTKCQSTQTLTHKH
jgi:hypothetical protein